MTAFVKHKCGFCFVLFFPLGVGIGDELHSLDWNNWRTGGGLFQSTVMVEKKVMICCSRLLKRVPAKTGGDYELSGL